MGVFPSSFILKKKTHTHRVNDFLLICQSVYMCVTVMDGLQTVVLLSMNMKFYIINARKLMHK